MLFGKAETFCPPPQPPTFQLHSRNCALMMLHEVAGRDFVVLFPGLNVSMLPVPGEWLQCLPYLAELGVALTHCLPHWVSLCAMKVWSNKKGDYCYIGRLLFSFIAWSFASFPPVLTILELIVHPGQLISERANNINQTVALWGGADGRLLLTCHVWMCWLFNRYF